MTQRLEEIRKKLFTHKKVSVCDLSKQFNVSEVTIRKDLYILEKEGIAERIYGGAVLKDNALSSVLSHVENPVQFALAQRACNEVEDGDSIFLGSGQTCCYLAKLLNRFHRLSVVTNNITALSDLLCTDARVYLIGGEVTSTDAKTMFSCPENTEKFTENIFVSKAFTSISGIDLQAGLTVHSAVSTHIYRSLPSMTRTWYLMADSKKFNKIAIFPVAEFSSVNYLITDSMPREYYELAEREHIHVLYADRQKKTDI